MTTPVRIGSEFLVNTTTSSDQLAPRVAGLSGGGFVVTWQDDSATGGDTSGSAVRGQVFTADGSPSGGEFLVNTTTASPQQTPRVAGLSGGGFVVTWQDDSATGGDTSGSAVRGQVFAANGSLSGGEFLVNTTTANAQTRSSVTALGTGGFVVTWQDDSAAGGDTSGSAVRGQAFAANGSPSGGEFLVNTTTANGQSRPSVTALTNGDFVVTWQDDSATGGDTSGSAVRGQVFAANGSPSGGEFLVNTTTANAQTRPSVTALNNGNFVVVWEDESHAASDTDGSAVRGQVFAADGSKVGGEFLVNTTTASEQYSPSVAPLRNGGFVVTWEDYSATAGVTADLRGQAFAADGSKDGNEFLVNTTTAGAQNEPGVAALSNEGFVVVWEDWSATGGDSSGAAVRAQIFHPTGLSIAATDASKAEGGTGGTAFTFTVTRSGDITGASSAHYAVTGTGGHAASADDFQGGAFPTGTVSFAAGEDSKTITIMVAGDGVVETDEGFTVTLSIPTGAAIATASANGTILNDDQSPPADTGGGNSGNGSDSASQQDQTVTVPASGVVDALIAMLHARVTDPVERQRLAASIATYAPSSEGGMIAIRTVVPTSADDMVSAASLIGGNARDVLMVDARQLPADAKLKIQDSGFTILLGGVAAHAGNGPQVLIGDGGRQVLTLGSGADTVRAGAGDDVVASGAGNDALYGEEGADHLLGGEGADLLFGNTGTDLLLGNAGADTLYGGQGNDTLYGGQDDDLACGDLGDDLISGDFGADRLFGNMGADTLHGGQGADTLFGGQGDDWLDGGEGDDLLWGDRGDDTIRGGAGADIFAFQSGSGIDRITDFSVDEGDRIGVSAGMTHSVVANGAGEAVIVFSALDRVTLTGVAATLVQDGWFVPV